MFARRAFTRAFSSSSAARDVARLTLVGRIGGDLTTQISKAGREYIRYPLAVRTGKEETSWFNVSVFDDQAIGFMQEYLTKGSVVYVEADASMSTYQVQAEDGLKNRSSLNLIQQSISPIVWKPKSAIEAEQEASAAA